LYIHAYISMIVKDTQVLMNAGTAAWDRHSMIQ
jgi:hypothetical protein